MALSRLVSQDAGQPTAPIGAWPRRQIRHSLARRSAALTRVPGPILASEPAGAAGQRGAGPACTRRVGDRYRLDDLIRVVNGAPVWRGTDEVLNRAVMVWVLQAGEPVAAEVRAAVLGAARVSDPRIAQIFDADCSTDHPYVISEWPGGEYLEDLLVPGLPEPWTAATMIMVAAGAVASAHDAGRPHLCLTPRSLLLGRTGLKITGLGIEAALSGTAAADPAVADTRALAGLLYALLTGYWPGEGTSALPRAPRQRGSVYAAGRARAGVPGVLDAITRRALLPGTAARITTPAELAWELRRARRILPLSGAEILALACR